MDREVCPLLTDFPVVVTLPIQWGDQDAFGHVNNTVYLRWYETARIAYGERVGFDRLMKSIGVGPILAAIHCNYRKQSTYPDTVQIGARITRLGKSSLSMEHQAVSMAQQAVIADGDSTIVCFNYRDQRPTPIPADMRAAIEALEGKSL